MISKWPGVARRNLFHTLSAILIAAGACFVVCCASIAGKYAELWLSALCMEMANLFYGYEVNYVVLAGAYDTVVYRGIYCGIIVAIGAFLGVLSYRILLAFRPGSPDGHTRCGNCGYILKGLVEPRCSECGTRI